MSKVEDRRNLIIQLLKDEPVATVTDMAAKLEVTPETIRKDLHALQKQDRVIRIHGGAALVEDDAKVPYTYREHINAGGKNAIAREAVKLIDANDSILIENSTTAMALCQELLKIPELLQTLVIFTNSFHLVSMMQTGVSCSRLFFLGGWVRPTERATHGHHTVQLMSQFHVDKSFISAAAVDEKLRLSAYYEDDMLFQKGAIEQADRAVLLFDQSKYPSSGMFSVGSVYHMQTVVTDFCFSSAERQNLEKHGIETVYAQHSNEKTV